MNIEKSIENIVAKCDNYIDPQLAICIIRDNCTMGSNNIGELKKYGIENEDSYVEKVLKYFRKKDKFAVFKNADLKDYQQFKKILLTFRSYYGLEEFNLKEIDQYMWQLGKEYFPKKYK